MKAIADQVPTATVLFTTHSQSIGSDRRVNPLQVTCGAPVLNYCVLSQRDFRKTTASL